MMNYFFKLLLTIDSLSLSLMVFLIKEGVTINSLHLYLSYVIYFAVIVLFTAVILFFIRYLDNDVIEQGCILTIEPANDAFLPSYLGYFFVALSVPNIEIFLCVFIIISIFIFSSRISYFNPIFFLFGYQFYYIQTDKHNKILIISKRLLKNPKTLSLKEIKRINDYTFINIEGRNDD